MVPAQRGTDAGDSKRLQPIVEVFEAQTSPLGSGGTNFPEKFAAVIVVSRAVPRPSEVSALLMSVRGKGRYVRQVFIEACLQHSSQQ